MAGIMPPSVCSPQRWGWLLLHCFFTWVCGYIKRSTHTVQTHHAHAHCVWQCINYFHPHSHCVWQCINYFLLHSHSHPHSSTSTFTFRIIHTSYALYVSTLTLYVFWSWHGGINLEKDYTFVHCACSLSTLNHCLRHAFCSPFSNWGSI